MTGRAQSVFRRRMLLVLTLTAMLALVVPGRSDAAPSGTPGSLVPTALPVAAAAASTPAAAVASPAPIPVVSGNLLLDSRSGSVFVPRGVNWPSFEYACAQGWGYSRDTATAATAAAISSWKANTVRIPLNQDCWLGTHGSPVSDVDTPRTAAGYRAAVADFVGLLNAAGLVVILDLHTFSTATSNGFGQRAMPDASSVTFWSQVAGAFASNHSVMFDAYNEPYSRWNDATSSWAFQLTWTCWASGGCHPPLADDNSPVTSATYPAAGMTQIVSAVRTAGATQPVMLGGLDYANDLRGWLANRPDDGQLVASFHNYDGQRCHAQQCWNAEIAPVAAVVPLVTGEFGDDNGAAFVNNYMTWADSHNIGYLAWAWWVEPDLTLALLTDDNGTARSPLGTALKTHLEALAPQNPSVAGTFVALAPARLVDTRSSTPLGAGGTLTVQIDGRAGVPPSGGASAVVLNVAVIGPGASGYITAYPSSATRTRTSNLDFAAGQTVANLLVVQVGTDGKINLYNGSGGRTQLIVDLAGYYRSGPTTLAGSFHALTSSRVLDTRNGAGTPVPPRGVVSLTVAGIAGVPAGAAAVALTLTATSPTASGFALAYSGRRPTTSSLNFDAGHTVANLVVVPIDANGKVQLYNGSAGTTHLLADVAGYYLGGSATAAGTYRSVTPTRVLDTRISLGGAGPVAPSGTVAVAVPSTLVPAGSTAVVNVTAVSAPTGGYLTVYSADIARPGTSNVDYSARVTVANLVVVPVDTIDTDGTDGKFLLYNGSAGPTPLLADVVGYFVG